MEFKSGQEVRLRGYGSWVFYFVGISQMNSGYAVIRKEGSDNYLTASLDEIEAV